MNLLKAASVAKKLDTSRSMVFKLAREDKTFPKPVKFSSRHSAWVEVEIDQWLFTKTQERN